MTDVPKRRAKGSGGKRTDQGKRFKKKEKTDVQMCKANGLKESI